MKCGHRGLLESIKIMKSSKNFQVSIVKGNTFLPDKGSSGHLKALNAAPCIIINSVQLVLQ